MLSRGPWFLLLVGWNVAVAQTWTTTGSLNLARYQHTATLLPDGRVLVAGGTGGSNTAETYDPATGVWSLTGPMAQARRGHDAVLLPDERVLVAGGDAGAAPFGSAEVFDPATNLWTSVGSMALPRTDHAAALLPDGRALVSGGRDGGASSPVASCELFDPATDSWSPTGSLQTARYLHHAVGLPTGEVFAIGGTPEPYGAIAETEVYDATSGIWSSRAPRSRFGVWNDTALLQTGEIMSAGGDTAGSSGDPWVELYDPVLDIWQSTGRLRYSRAGHALTVLPNGQVLVTGGTEYSFPSMEFVELYSPSRGSWSVVSPMNQARYFHTATLLSTGDVLVAGGKTGAPLSHAERYTPCPGLSIAPASLPGGNPGVPYSQQVSATGGTPPYTFAVSQGNLPAGLTLNGATGMLAGTPTVLGTANFTVTVTDALGCTGSQAYTLSIDCPPIQLSPSTLPPGTAGRPYAETLGASGGTSPYQFGVTAGLLPAGLSLMPNGALSGIPSTTGIFAFTVGAIDAAGCSGSAAYLLRIDPVLNDYLVGQGTDGTRIRLFDGTGAPTATSFTAYGSSPGGVRVSAGDLDGDAVAEIATGVGTGGPHVRGFRRDGAALATVSFYAYGTLQGGVNVTTPDSDTDRMVEIVTGAGPGAVFAPHVRGWNVDGGPLSPIGRINFFAYQTLKYGVTVSGGDLDGDRFEELLTGAGPSPVFASHIRGWNVDASTSAPLPGVNFVATSSGWGVATAAGDADGDSYSEIAFAPGPGPLNPAAFLGVNYDGVAIAPWPGFAVTPISTMFGGHPALGVLDPSPESALICSSGPDPTADATVWAFRWGAGALQPIPGTPLLPSTTGHGCYPDAGPFGY